MHAQLLVVWEATKLAWQQYLENRYDPETPMKRPRAYKRNQEKVGRLAMMYGEGADSFIAGVRATS